MVQVSAGRIIGADIAAWPYSVGILIRFTFFLVPCIGLLVLMILVTLVFLFLELLIFSEQWAGHRLLSEKVTRPHFRANRPILIPSVPVSVGIEIRHGCQFLSSLVRALAKLPGGLGRFLPCELGSHMSRLRHLGWNQCSHGLSSRPLESCHHLCLKAVCGFWGILNLKVQLWSFLMASQSFSSPWGWVLLCTWERLEPALGGYRRWGVSGWSVQPK